MYSPPRNFLMLPFSWLRARIHTIYTPTTLRRSLADASLVSIADAGIWEKSSLAISLLDAKIVLGCF
jgi:hypothetical protein